MRVFALLARYEALAGPKHTPGGMGGSGGGSGSQAAVPASVIHAFEQWADMPPGSCIECFASPLNHRNVFEPRQYAGAPWTQANIRELLGASPWYCSAFEDVDAPFGGGVNFFYSRRGASRRQSLLMRRRRSRPTLSPFLVETMAADRQA